MNRGGFLVAASSGIALAACSVSNVQVRAIPDPAAKLRTGAGELADARNMLLMNSIGLALEAFRKAEIEQPANPQVYVGIAQCYAAMGRFDLESANYERALAYAPHDTTVLAAYAVSLEHQGELARAAEVRAELALDNAPPMQAPQTGSLTIKLPPVRRTIPADQLANVRLEEARTDVRMPNLKGPSSGVLNAGAATVDLVTRPILVQNARPLLANVTAYMPIAVMGSASPELPSAEMLEPSDVTARAAPATNLGLASASPLIDVTSELVQRRKDQALPVVSASNAIRSHPDRTAAPRTATLVAELIDLDVPFERRMHSGLTTLFPMNSGPRLERLSIGEVALVTGGASPWPSRIAALSNASIRWLPMTMQQAQIRLLNAARFQGLAARTRSALADRGWRKLYIGNYREVRQSSLVLYSKEQRPAAERLAAQLNCKAVLVNRKEELVVLLGRDWARRRPTSLRG